MTPGRQFREWRKGLRWLNYATGNYFIREIWVKKLETDEMPLSILSGVLANLPDQNALKY